MALLLIDGFEGYSSVASMISQSGTTRWFYNAGTPTFDSTTYRTTQVTPANSRSLFMSQTGSSITIPATTQEIIIGFGFRWSGNAYNNRNLISFGQTNPVGQGIGVGLFQNGQMYIGAPSNNINDIAVSVVTVSPTNLAPNVWYYLEFRALRGGAGAGQFEIRINGVVDTNVTMATNGGGITGFGNIAIGAASGNTYNIDDVYVLDTTGATNNTFLNPVSVYTLMPNGAGSSTGLSVTGSATNWQSQSEVSDDTTTYVDGSNTGDKDYYTFQDLPSGVSTIPGVAVKARCTTPDPGTRKVKLNMKDGSANVSSSSAQVLSMGSWLQYQHLAEKAPDNSAWTKVAVDGLEAGIEGA